MKYKILKNDRVGTGYRDSSLKCTNCNCVTTRYIKFINEDVTINRLCPAIFCGGCLHNMIKEMQDSLLTNL